MPVTVTVKFVVLFFCKFSPPKKKFARKKGIAQKRETCSLISFFYVAQKRETCLLISFFYVMPLNLHDPASIFRSRTTARLFSARSLMRWYRFNGSLFYLCLTYLNQFIKSSLIKLYSPQFRCMAALYNITWINVKQMFVFLKKN